MTLVELKQYILDQLAAPVTVVQKIINVFNAVVDHFTGNTVTSIIPDWAADLTFQTDGTGSGKFCIYADSNGKKRIFETKTDDNINNTPPSNPSTTENTYWLEISQAGSSAIVEWEAKLYGAGLVIVYYNHSTLGRLLCILTEASRPFNSTNIETEITAGKWDFINLPNATETVAGKSEESTLAEMLAATTTGGSGARLFVGASKFCAGVVATVLTGYTVGSNAIIAATDTVLTAMGKIQAQLNAKMNLGSNTSLENLGDASDEYAIGLLSRLGVVFRSEFLKWNETLQQLTIVGSQAIWRAYEAVTNGNMGIKVLEAASEAFKIFDDIGNFMSVGVESGKRFFRVFTNLRLYNGVSYSEAEFKSVECFASVTTELKAITIPTNCQLTVEITGINVQNVDKNSIFGYAQFHFKNDGGAVTDLSQDELRYDHQYSTIKGTDGYVINTDTRIDASITDQTVSINFVNTVAKHTITQCEIKYNIVTLPEAP